MGITISYRGCLPDTQRVEDFEDRVVDLALELGGQVRIWRSAREGCPERMVRGVILELCPGLESGGAVQGPQSRSGPRDFGSWRGFSVCSSSHSMPLRIMPKTSPCQPCPPS